MGHRVSTPRHSAARGNNKGGGAVASLAILLAVASATAFPSSSSLDRHRGRFLSQRPRPSSAAAAASGGITLRVAAYSSVVAAAAATVPPPNSRLGQRRRRSRQSSSSALPLELPGTKHKREGGGGRSGGGGSRRGLTDLRYASYGSHYAQYCSNGMEEELELDAGRNETNKSSSLSSSWEGFSAMARATEVDSEEQVGSSSPSLAKKHSERRRARMLRFLDRRLARLHPKNPSRSSSRRCSDDPSSSDPDSARRLEYEQRKAAWAAKYTSVSTLRKSFGSNKNRLWGDFDPALTRRLYHTLLPRALLELRGLRDGLLSSEEEEELAGGRKNEGRREGGRREGEPTSNGGSRNSYAVNANGYPIGGDDDEDDSSYLQRELRELAPLAYRARLAAKKYARERSRVPGRIGSMLYDGYRSWRRYGKWTMTGMTWEQVWSKYEDQVLRELEGGGGGLDCEGGLCMEDDLDEEELTSRICLRILERSVVTNEAIDRLFLKQLEEDDDEEDAAAAERNAAAEDSQKRRQRRRRKQRRKLRHRLRMQADLAAIEKKFDEDIQELLRYADLTTERGEEQRRSRRRGVRASIWRKLSGSRPPDEVEGGEEADVSGALPSAAFARGGDDDAGREAVAIDNGEAVSARRGLAVHEVFALRILATTKQRIELLQTLPYLGGGTQVDDAGSDSDDADAGADGKA